jgi:hypothetical protein
MTPSPQAQRSRTVAFFHIMKTGGTTFHGMLSALYGDSFHVCVDPSIDAIASALRRFDCLELHTAAYRGDFVHMLADVAADRRWDVFENCEVFTMLREPVAQTVSLYCHIAAKRQFIESTYVKNGVPFPESLEEFIESPWHFNNQLAFLTGNNQLTSKALPDATDLATTKAVLLKLRVHAGLIERYADSLHIFETVTGRRIPGRTIESRNRNPMRPSLRTLPPRILEEIRRKSTLDIELYEFARSLFEKELALCGPSPVYTFEND